MSRFLKQFDEIPLDFEQNGGDYLVDDRGYESIPDLLARCMRSEMELPTSTPGLVEDIEVGESFNYEKDGDRAFFPEDVQQQESEPAVKPSSDLADNINESEQQQEA